MGLKWREDFSLDVSFERVVWESTSGWVETYAVDQKLKGVMREGIQS